jgi:predicted phage terminase large subunit-like protein
VVEAIREKLHPDDLVDKIFDLAKKYQVTRVGIEDEAYQKSLVHWLRREMPRYKYSFNVIPVKIPRNIKKYARFEALQPFLHNGLIKFRKDMPGKADIIDEFEQYPKGATDDLIAALAMLPMCTIYPPKRRRRNKEKPTSLTAEFLETLIRKESNGDRRGYLPRITVQ